MEVPNKKLKPSVTTPRRTYRRMSKAPMVRLDEPGRLWFPNLMHLFGDISHQTLYAGIKSGKYPPADGRDGQRQFWKTSTVRRFLEGDSGVPASSRENE